MMGGILFVALIILICFGFLMIFFHNRVSNLSYKDQYYVCSNVTKFSVEVNDLP